MKKRKREPRKKFENENWSYYRVRKLADAAEHYVAGSKNWKPEYDELMLYNKRLARLANSRLRALKKAGKDYYAYDSAISFTDRMYGTTRYKETLESPQDVKRQILSMQRFLNFETSTVEGHLAVEERRRTKFRQLFRDITDDVSDTELDNFLRFLGTAPLRTTIYESGQGGSGTLVDLIRGQYMGADSEHKEEIKGMFERYRATMERRTLDGQWRDYDLGYDELVQYLETGEDPTGYNQKGER